jgi:hypothetical protein
MVGNCITAAEPAKSYTHSAIEPFQKPLKFCPPIMGLGQLAFNHSSPDAPRVAIKQMSNKEVTSSLAYIHVCVNPASLKDGEHVVVCCTLLPEPQHVAMTCNSVDGSVWQASIPVSADQTEGKAMMRFAKQNGNEPLHFEEFIRHFAPHLPRHNYFKSLLGEPSPKTPQRQEVLQFWTLHEYGCHQRNEIGDAELEDRLTCLTDRASSLMCTAADAEAVFEALVEQCETQLQQVVLRCLLKAVGTLAPVQRNIKAEEPPPSWCAHTCQHLDVSGLLALQREGHDMHALQQGLNICAKYMHKAQDFSWLRVAPLLSKQPPRTHLQTASAAALSSFKQAITAVAALAEAQLADANNDTAAAAQCWSDALLSRAPSLALLAEVCELAQVEAALGSERVAAAIVARVSSYKFAKVYSELRLLDALLQKRAHSLATPALALALLENTTIKLADKSKEQMLVYWSLLERCFSCNSSSSSSSSSSDAEGRLSGVDDGSVAAAAGNWLQRHHKTKASFTLSLKSVASGAFSLITGTREQRASDERAAALQLALQHVQSLLCSLPPAATAASLQAAVARGLITTLHDCWFLQQRSTAAVLYEPTAALAGICDIAAAAGSPPVSDSWGPVQPVFAEAVTAVARSSCNEVSDTAAAVHVVCEKLTSDSTLACQLLHSLLTVDNSSSGSSSNSSSSSSAVAVEDILLNSAVWQRLFVWGSSISSTSGEHSPFTTLLQKTAAQLAAFAEAVHTGHLSLVQFETVLSTPGRQHALLQLLTAMNSTATDAAALAAQTAAAVRFRTGLTHLSAFAAQFCGGAVPVDAAAVNTALIQLRYRCDSSALQLCELEQALADVAVVPHIAWLCTLRGSDLFMSLWAAEGQVLQQREFAVAATASTAAATIAAAEEFHDAAAGEDSGDEGFYDASDSAAALQAAQQQQQQRAQPLSLQTVTQTLIPAVKECWNTLAESVLQGSMPLSELQTAFGRVPVAQRPRELRFLATTRDSCSSDSSSGSSSASSGDSGSGSSSGSSSIITVDDVVAIAVQRMQVYCHNTPCRLMCIYC